MCENIYSDKREKIKYRFKVHGRKEFNYDL